MPGPPKGVPTGSREIETTRSRDELQRIGRELAAAKRAGLSFETAWRQALATVDEDERYVLRVTAEAWRDAFLDRPAPRSVAAVARLAVGA